jgi:hypothetical protein
VLLSPAMKMLKQTISEDDIQAGGIGYSFKPLYAEVKVSFPAGSEIVSAGVQKGDLVVWAICPDADEAPYTITIVGTGPRNDFTDIGKFLASIQLRTADSGYLVVHLFWRKG